MRKACKSGCFVYIYKDLSITLSLSQDLLARKVESMHIINFKILRRKVTIMICNYMLHCNIYNNNAGRVQYI